MSEKPMTLTREQVIEMAKQAGLTDMLRLDSEDSRELSVRRVQSFAALIESATEKRAYTAGRAAGLGEAKEAFSLSEHMHARNSGLMLCISDLSDVILRMVNGIDHLSEIARQWEPDHSSGVDRQRWLLANYARDDALRLLKEHTAAIEQLKEQSK